MVEIERTDHRRDSAVKKEEPKIDPVKAEEQQKVSVVVDPLPNCTK